jgi:hypothetical protein
MHKVILQRKKGGVGKMAMVGYESVTLAIGVCLFLSFAVVFTLTYFCFCLQAKL